MTLESLVDVLWAIKPVPDWVSWCSFSITPSHREGCQVFRREAFLWHGTGRRTHWEQLRRTWGSLWMNSWTWAKPVLGCIQRTVANRSRTGCSPSAPVRARPERCPQLRPVLGQRVQGRARRCSESWGCWAWRRLGANLTTPSRSWRERDFLARQRAPARGAGFQAGGAGPAGRWGGAAGPPRARQVPLKVSRQPRGQWRRRGAGPARP